MNKKYIGKQVALKPEIFAELEKVREALTIEFGFKPSLSETIAWLMAQYKKMNEIGEGHGD